MTPASTPRTGELRTLTRGLPIPLATGRQYFTGEMCRRWQNTIRHNNLPTEEDRRSYDQACNPKQTQSAPTREPR